MLALVAVVRKTGEMKLERKHGWLLIAIAVWNVVVWGTFIEGHRRVQPSARIDPRVTTLRTRC